MPSPSYAPTEGNDEAGIQFLASEQAYLQCLLTVCNDPHLKMSTNLPQRVSSENPYEDPTGLTGIQRATSTGVQLHLQGVNRTVSVATAFLFLLAFLSVFKLSGGTGEHWRESI